MKRAEALQLVATLMEFAKESAGFRRDEEIARICFSLTMGSSNPDIAEKLTRARATLEIWTSPRKWQRFGYDEARMNAITAVTRLQWLVEEVWPE